MLTLAQSRISRRRELRSVIQIAGETLPLAGRALAVEGQLNNNGFIELRSRRLDGALKDALPVKPSGPYPLVSHLNTMRVITFM